MNWRHILFFPVAILRFILLCLVLVIFLFGYLALTATVIKHTTERAYKLRHIFLHFVIPIMGIRIERKGKPIDQTALYVCNHRSFSDPVICCFFVDAYVIAKAEVEDMPFLDRGAKLTGIIYVKRDSETSRKSTRLTMIKTLKEDLSVLVYPEGTTNVNLRTKEYRMGTFKEAAIHGFPVVPIAIEYKTPFDIWDGRSLIHQFFYQYSKLITRVKLEIGDPIASDDMIVLRNKVEEWTNQSIQRMHDEWGTNYLKTGGDELRDG